MLVNLRRKLIQNKKAIFAVVFLSLSILLLSGSYVLAQDANVGGLTNEFAAQAGFGTTDIRLTIASIIRIVMGLLGIIATLIVLYGGFIWMTAAGNEEKITKAKKILIGGVIGLIITVSSFGISYFVINNLLQATGGGGTGTGPGPGPGPGPTESFVIRSITPQGNISIRNAVVRIIFNRDVDPATVAGNIIISKTSDDSNVTGTLVTSGAMVEFTPAAVCPAPNQDRKCFDGNTEFSVNINNGASGVKSADGKTLTCGLGGANCEGYFTTGNLVDVAAPDITITSPFNGEPVSGDALVPIQTHITDDSGISLIEYYADDRLIGVDSPTDSPSPVAYNSIFNWDTTGLAILSNHTIKAKAFDVDSNQKESSSISVLIRAAHCFNRVLDSDEKGIDCGGNDCGACSGARCDAGGSNPDICLSPTNNLCASNFCNPSTCACAELPVVTLVDPANGAAGNMITISGQYFGDTAGQVVFLGGAAGGDDKIVTTAPAGCAANSWWSDNQIIVQVPTGAVDGPLKVIAANNFYDTTDNDRGWQGNFDVNNTVRPGLCLLDKTEGVFKTLVKLTGNNFGSTKRGVTFSYISATAIGAWANTEISDVAVPNINPGEVKVQVKVGAEYSNGLNFTVKSAPNLPHIDYVNPIAGPRSQYVTIYGSNFGNESGLVYFKNNLDTGSGLGDLADTSFPEACAAAFWHDSYITVKVPNVVDIGGYKIKVIRKDTLESNIANFNINNRLPTPGICRIDPDNGKEQTPVMIFGERFGSYLDTKSKIRFWENKFGTLASFADWQDGQVKTTVPFSANTGPANIIDASGTKSNDFNFRVGSCPKDYACYPSEDCCGDGTCKLKGACPTVAANISHYTWPFRTGAVNYGIVPKVIEKDCAASKIDNSSMSPGPYRNTTDNCLESLVLAKFNTDLKNDSLVNLSTKIGITPFYSGHPNISIRRCNAGVSVVATSCLNEVAGDVKITAQDSDEEGVIFRPAVNFSLNTWYRVTLRSGTTGIRSNTGLLLDGNQDDAGNFFSPYQNGDEEEGGSYVWFFRIKNTPGACAIDRVVVEPENKVTLGHALETQNYDSLPYAANCNLLNPENYNWGWSSILGNGSDGSGVAIISQDKSTATGKTDWLLPWQMATAQNTSGTTFITAEEVDSTKKDNSQLAVNLNLPYISSITPDNGIAKDYATTYTTITGNNFGAEKGNSRVLINGREAAIACNQWFNRQIIAIVPVGLEGVAPIQIITAGGDSNIINFTVNNIIRPNICQIIPNFGKVGDPTKIIGSNFGDTYIHGTDATLNSYFKFFANIKRGDKVSIDRGLATDITNWSTTEIQNKVPAASRSGNVSVTVLQNQSNTVNFTMRPFIDRLSPDRGPNGTWATVFGGNFGNPWCSNPSYKTKAACDSQIGTTWNLGKVYFYKSDGATSTKGDVTANNLIEAQLAPCDGAWSDTQIVVVMPAGAQTGLVRVETNMPSPYTSLITTEEYSKSFTLNSDPLGPGICELNPNHGVLPISVTVNGDRFEDNPRDGKLIFSDNQIINYPAISWVNKIISAQVPAQTVTGPVKVTKTITIITGRRCTGIPFFGICIGGGWVDIAEDKIVASNEVNYTVEVPGACTSDADCTACAGSVCDLATNLCTPSISNFTPKSGAIGTWVTVSGCYFGCTKGQVVFADNKPALWPNPGLCGNTWKCYADGTNDVIAEVPDKTTPVATDDAIIGLIKLVRADGVSTDTNTLPVGSKRFVVNTTQMPGICRLEPDFGQRQTKFNISGQNFEDAPIAGSDKVKFTNAFDVVSFIADATGCGDGWSDSIICLNVPGSAPYVLSPVWVVKGARASNQLSFNVESLTTCSIGQTACSDSCCAADESCNEEGNGGKGTCDNHICLAGQNWCTESNNCCDSPCVGEGVCPTGGGAFCGNGKAENGEQCDGSDFSMSDDVCKLCGADFTASGCGASGTDNACKVNTCVNPEGKVCEFICHNYNQTSGVRECWVDLNNDRAIDANEYGTPVKVGTEWKCQVGGTTYDAFNGVEQCDDNDFDGISCTDWGQNKGSLSCNNTCTINNTGCYVPQVTEDQSCTNNSQSPTPWKDSTDACRNSLISARFTMNMDDTALEDSENITVKKCNADNTFTDAACSPINLSGTLSIINNNTDLEGFIFKPSGNLDGNTWYKVSISKNVKSVGGIAMTSDYPWHFRTADTICSVDHLTVTPKTDAPLVLTALLPHPTRDYTALLTAANCNILNSAGYAFDWNSTNTGVATVEASHNESNTATAQAQGTTKIQATSENKSDEAILNVSPIPQVEDWSPKGTNICRNAVVRITFNQEMDEVTLISGNLLLQSCPGNDCTVGTDIDNAITYAVEDNKTIVTLTPSNSFDPTTKYQVTVKGGDQGVKNTVGIAMAVDKNWTFTTGNASNFCKISSVEITVRPPGAVQTEDYFLCAGKDNCVDDRTTEFAGNQHIYSAQAFDANHIALQANYTWIRDDIYDPKHIIGFTSKVCSNNSKLSCTSNANCGTGNTCNLNNTNDTQILKQIYVTGNPVQEATAIVPVAANGTCGDDCGYAQNEVAVTIFMCNNPWPAIKITNNSWSPYLDRGNNCTPYSTSCLNSNFLTYYCRDAGDPSATNDDLPALKDPNSTSTTSKPAVLPGMPPANFFKEFLFTRDTNTNTPSGVLTNNDGSSDAIGIRLLQNPNHLPPLKWYTDNVPRPGSPSIIDMDGYAAVQDGRTIYANAANLMGNCGTEDKIKTCPIPGQTGGVCGAGNVCDNSLYCASITSTSCSQNSECKNIKLGGLETTCIIRSSFYTNIYLISWNENANTNTQNIYNQMMANWRFNANLPSATKDKLVRDTKRLEDLNTIKDLLDAYKAKTGKYPTLDAGTFIKGQTLSIWPSWQAVLGNALGVNLPIDPLNKLGMMDATSCVTSNTNKCSDNQTICCPANKICIAGLSTKLNSACSSANECNSNGKTDGKCEFKWQCSTGGQPKCSTPCPQSFDPVTCWNETTKTFAFP
jgi:hypothetical protein